MDAIKKKMQAMKVEKDNAMDRSDACEQAAKDAKVRAAKAEEEVADLVKKAQQLEVELDKTKEELQLTTEKLKDKENALSAAELEVGFSCSFVTLFNNLQIGQLFEQKSSIS